MQKTTANNPLPKKIITIIKPNPVQIREVEEITPIADAKEMFIKIEKAKKMRAI
jgi:hypothetical protein